ncbi:ATP-dependent helicase HrpB [Pseudarthrobacter chlorophenolicus A6]|uniref:ATP-dependent helicase HrpB n=1 Tax=Pseudarthrobacter chlorophenolicus (strain ATCC 700700 / DSM 12829 / CIP 107037 / JCM 12360 / KCTC 9906 / NCIMB 13794 / A6) TaxID=452863 RepID=B8H7I3_PSECP|nr:ATP-dependent helicase HrpB [Pseudarthrobacter chlorophenolicus A6]SDQ94148.1 ATP-dependent helicase HrpB [Pseudarthrobacter chlorophenolicus]
MPSGPSAIRDIQPFDLGAIGADLAFARSLPDLRRALDAGGPSAAAVVQAPPGTGKTTLLPPLLANLAGGAGRIVVTQPRRVAARAAARRLAGLDAGPLGGRVGYTVRGERRAGPETLVEFVTPGILLRRLLADPGLTGVAGVVLDEVHERGLETDLLVGMLAEVRQLRGDLQVVAMSATVEAARFAALLGDPDGGLPAPVVDSPSVLHALEVRWHPAPAPRLDDRGVTRAFLDHVAATAADAQEQALRTDPSSDALVFLPGAREVAHVAAGLRHRLAAAVDVLELHGQAGAAEQDRAVSGRLPGGKPRIIVSTDLAESSLTVPGVRLVIDSGLAREPRRDAARGMAGLVTVSCARASAEQRAGRAARQGPGTVVHCYSQQAFGAAPAHAIPEIRVADLAGAALTLACWGSPGGQGLALPDAPPRQAMDDAMEVLRELGAVTQDGHATATGRVLAEIPADPRLARALLDGAAEVGAQAAAEVVAALAGDQRAPDADLPRLLGRLRTEAGPAQRRWQEETRRLEGLVRRYGRTPAGHTGHALGEAPGTVVALAYPDRVARLVPGDGPARYLLSSGTRAGLPAGSSLGGHEWLAVAEVSRAEGRDAAGTGAVIRSAAPLTAAQAESAAGHLLGEAVEAEFRQGRVTARKVRRLGAIVLAETPVRPTPEAGRAAVSAALRRDGLALLDWSTAARDLRGRLALLHRELGGPWPDVSDGALLQRLDEWLGPELQALAEGAAVARIDLAGPLRNLLPWPEAARFDELAPEWLGVPSGSRIRVAYPVPGEETTRPVVAVKLQECFGLAESPRLAGGRVPVLFHLLSPARRPLAVTDDLTSFWSGPYAQVRAEMRGRYPRHPWPEDPWAAPATARTNRRN